MTLSISVAMCTYNGQNFLHEQLASIAAQDRLPEELIVCDDGSSDGTRETLEAFGQRCGFATKIVVNDLTLGSTKNFEKAISLCHGKIVALADQDDVWYPQKLKKIEEVFLGSSATVAAFSDADLIDHNSQLLDGRLWSAFSFDAGEQDRFANHRPLEVLVKHPVATGATMAFLRELFEILIPIPPNHIHDRWVSFLLAARGEVKAIPEPLIKYRRHAGQQEGVPPQVRAELIEHAKRRGAEFHLEEIERFCALREHLRQRRADFPYAGTALIEIERKISHLGHRAQLPRQRLARIPLVVQESLNRGYWRYSAGWNSIARDLLIR
ncbi:MAG TPA: glycosyltransferase family 2 protein [Candidatus Sulfotelmatobacter sp.]|nr:glycosyltransferase family 2 protein [Candidatus Sulfotelmatobacter sp.]